MGFLNDCRVEWTRDGGRWVLLRLCLLLFRSHTCDILRTFLMINRGGVPQTDEHIARIRVMYGQALLDEAGGA